ncbi:MAG: hypothetical protein KDH95_09835 [Calditrichaeota bacterium]|nr:hypothetical protein [Calditrichota bacterium]
MNIFDSRNNFEWRDYLKIFFRRKWFFLVPFLLVMALGVSSILFKEGTYESYSIIQIHSSRLPSQLSKLLPGVLGVDGYRDWKKQILSSDYLTHTIKTVGLDKNEAVISEALAMQENLPDKTLDEIVNFLLIKKLREKISVKQYQENMVEIRAQANNSEVAHLIVKTLIEYFREDFLEKEVSNIQSALKFSVEQIEEFQQKLKESESRYNSYRRNVLGNQASEELLTPESTQRIRDAIVTSELTMREKRDDLMRLNDLLRSYNLGNSIPVSLSINTQIVGINQKINEEAQLLKRFAPGSAELMRVSRSINMDRENLRSEFEKYYTRQYASADPGILSSMANKALALLDLQISEKRITALNDVLNSSRQQTTLNQSQESALEKLEEEVGLNRDIYNLLLQQAQGTQIEEAMQRANAASRISIIEPPTKPLEPDSSGKNMLALITMVVSMVLGFVAVYVREYFDGTLQTVEETEEFFNLPVLCVLPYLEKDQIKDRNNTDQKINLTEARKKAAESGQRVGELKR